jgi:hypothetical protein
MNICTGSTLFGEPRSALSMRWTMQHWHEARRLNRAPVQPGFEHFGRRHARVERFREIEIPSPPEPR